MAVEFTLPAIENYILLTATLVDAFLLLLLLCTPAAVSYAFALIVLAILLFLFLHDQVFLNTTEHSIETFQRTTPSSQAP